MQTEFHIQTHGQGLYELTSKVENFVQNVQIRDGLLTLFIRHTSASLLIQENADPEVQTDLRAYFSREKGSAKVGHGSGVIISLRAA